MNIVTTTCVMPYDRPAEETLKQLKHIGFRCLDLGFDALCKGSPFLSDEWENWAKSLKESADLNGVVYTHSHACADASARNDAVYRCFKVCKILVIPYTVIHPLWKKSDQTFYSDEDEFLEVNTKAILPLVDAAAEYGVTVLSENLLWGCSIYPEMIGKLVTAVGKDNFGWCFDTGHANACGLSLDEVKKAKHIPLSLHVQDNHGLFKDEHLLPGDGTIDWQHFMKLLKEIGYQGDLVLEAHHQSLEAKDEKERTLILSDLLARAEKMLNYSAHII